MWVLIVLGTKRSYPEVFAEGVACWIAGRVEVDDISYLKLKLGVEVLFIDLTKGLVVYGLAILLGMFVSALIVHLSYLALRRCSFGLHAKSSFNCTIVSVVMFIALPYVVRNWVLDFRWIFLLFTVSTCCFFLYAPADTEKNPLIGKERRLKLRNRAVFSCLALMGVTFMVPNYEVRVLIILGVVLQVVMILPLTYKMLGRSYQNYEKAAERIYG